MSVLANRSDHLDAHTAALLVLFLFLGVVVYTLARI